MTSVHLTFSKVLLLKRCFRVLINNVRNEHVVSNNAPKLNPFDVKRYGRRRFEEEKSTIASRMCVTVLGNNAIGQPPCLCVFTEHKCYMFNCGEGSMRIAKEQGITFVNAKHVFITENSWKNLSGLTDVYMTHHSHRAKRITLHGPPNVEEFLSVIEGTKTVKLKKVNFDVPTYRDDNIEVESVPIYSGNMNLSDITMFNGNSMKYSKTTKCVASYICKVRPKDGEFSPQKCIEYGVPVGPLLLKLKNGEDVVLPTGEQVLSQDVRDSFIPGCKFLVVDCPYTRFLDPLVSNKKLCSKDIEDVSAVFHFSPPNIMNSYRYQEWMYSFPSKTQHIILNSSNSSLSSELIHEIQHVLHMMHPRIFPLLKEKPKFVHNDWINKNVIQADSRLLLHIRPKLCLDRTNVVDLKPQNYIQKALEVPGFQNELTKLQHIINSRNENISKDRQLQNYPEITFLGTSSSTASAYRNTTAILVYTSPNNSILLDCGEGTYMQLVRYFGVEKIDLVLHDISAIFVSHHHTDHYLGLFEVIKARKKAFISNNKPYVPLAIITNSVVENLMSKFNIIFEPIRGLINVFLGSVLEQQVTAREELKHFVKDIEITPIPVIHCEESYGVVLQGDEWKIVYSGDASPSQTLVDAGQNCDLLIHEASIEDNLDVEALQRNHSTPSQVADIAEKMNAQYTIMTHFSKRYLVPVFTESDNIGCAFDNMTVRLCDLPLVPLFTPAVKALFSEQLEVNLKRSSAVVSFEKALVRNMRNNHQFQHSV